MRFTDKQFFDWEIEHGLYTGGSNKGFYEVHKKLAEFILQFHAGYINSHLDLGAGNSPITKILQDNGIKAEMVEQNKYSIELQIKNGVKIDNIFNEDFTQMEFYPFNFITSIEVFEHVEDEKLLPFIQKLSNHCEYFLFSSTPNKDTPEFDEQWGHVNIKSTDEWVRIFTESGFELMKEETEHLQKNCIPTTWTLMFKSLKHA
jgi:predicted TPR repeat methyltransferase